MKRNHKSLVFVILYEDAYVRGDSDKGVGCKSSKRHDIDSCHRVQQALYVAAEAFGVETASELAPPPEAAYSQHDIMVAHAIAEACVTYKLKPATSARTAHPFKFVLALT